MGNEVKVTNGIINANSGYKGSLSQYQFSAPIQPGNSVSPLFNDQGAVIGIINSGILSAENAGYAIKASFVQTFLDQIEGLEFNTQSTMQVDSTLAEKVVVLDDFIFIVKCSE